MPTCGYLVIPKTGKRDSLISEISDWRYCETVIPNQEDFFVLVTETPDNETENKLRQKIENHRAVQAANLTFGSVM